MIREVSQEIRLVKMLRKGSVPKDGHEGLANKISIR